MFAVGVNDEEIAAGFSEDVFVVGEPLNGVGGDAAVLPAEGFGFVYFDGVGFEFGGLEPVFGFLTGGIVEVNGALAVIGEELAIG